MSRYLLFDLDGTLTESGEGIIRSVQYALEKMGKPETDVQKLRSFIGPPLIPQFMSFSGMTRQFNSTGSAIPPQGSLKTHPPPASQRCSKP